MNYRDAKKRAWGAAYRILSSGPTPSTEANRDGNDEQMTDDDWRRWERAWQEIIDHIARFAPLD